MDEANSQLPETLDVERTEFQEQARDRADTMRRITFGMIGFAVVASLANVGVFVHQGWPPSTSVVVILGACAVLLPAMPGFMWHRAARQRIHYESRSESKYELRCDDSRHEWRIEGIGPATGWRDITIECKNLPRQSLSSPKLHVRIDNEQGVLKSGHLQDGGESTTLFVIDKQGLPIGITIGHAEPKHASQEHPWVVELTLFGDADALEALLAWPIAWDRETGSIEGDATDANRQA